MEQVKAGLIIEVLGRPPEHIVESLNQLIENMSKENGVSIMHKKIHEAKKIPENETLFTTFAEIEIEVRDIYKLIEIIFIYMPSSVEVFDPSEIKLKLDDVNMIINSLAARLHKYDAIAKRLNMERIILEKQLQEKGIKSAVAKLEEKEARQGKKQIKQEKGKQKKQGKSKQKQTRKTKKK
ncbi:hypothetical protein HZA33_02220 [Candidatus Pacearchaeota archaeon]|nr:hypothetical protein [Candidatus Pacearchaeota archaeon]